MSDRFIIDGEGAVTIYKTPVMPEKYAHYVDGLGRIIVSDHDAKMTRYVPLYSYWWWVATENSCMREQVVRSVLMSMYDPKHMATAKALYKELHP